jgi:hypothetical protein
MKPSAFIVAVLLLLGACSSCRRVAGRPDIYLYKYLPESGVWEGENGAGAIRQEKPENLYAVDSMGFLQSQEYVDRVELRVRQLERQLAQCGSR